MRLATLLQGVAACWGLQIELVRMPWRNIVSRTLPKEYNIKPPLNDHNISKQHIATLLGATYCVRLATLPRVGCCWLKHENAQIFEATFVDVI